MTTDTWTIMWKESMEMFRRQEGLRGIVLSMMVPVISMATLAIYPPVAVGPGWVESPFSLVASIFLPLTVVGMTIADSFAGERERHTLGTLLASRLPNRAILFGKMGIAVISALGITIVVHLVSLIALNVAHWEGELMLYSPTVALVNLVWCFLTAVLVAGVGALFSLRAATVQQATQNIMASLLAPVMLVSMIIFLIGTALPTELKVRLAEFLEDPVMTADFTQIALIVAAILSVINLGLLWAAMARFQRARLILS